MRRAPSPSPPPLPRSPPTGQRQLGAKEGRRCSCQGLFQVEGGRQKPSVPAAQQPQTPARDVHGRRQEVWTDGTQKNCCLITIMCLLPWGATDLIVTPQGSTGRAGQVASLPLPRMSILLREGKEQTCSEPTRSTESDTHSLSLIQSSPQPCKPSVITPEEGKLRLSLYDHEASLGCTEVTDGPGNLSGFT